eukprot:SAG11_NODE_661_length_7885_cov_8.956974_10_plen_119_part_00
MKQCTVLFASHCCVCFLRLLLVIEMLHRIWPWQDASGREGRQLVAELERTARLYSSLIHEAPRMIITGDAHQAADVLAVLGELYHEIADLRVAAYGVCAPHARATAVAGADSPACAVQ